MSLGSKGTISDDHMIFLAGRKQYDNRSQRIYGVSDLNALAENSSINMPEESLERALLSNSMSTSIDDTSSLHSYESSTSDFSHSDTVPQRVTLPRSSPNSSRLLRRDIDALSQGSNDTGSHQLTHAVSVDVNEMRHNVSCVFTINIYVSINASVCPLSTFMCLLIHLCVHYQHLCVHKIYKFIYYFRVLA